MSSVPTPALDQALSRIALSLEIANADPSGEIVLGIVPSGPGSVGFGTGPAAASWQPPTGKAFPEFIAIDPAEVMVSVGPRRCRGEIDFSVPLEIVADSGVRSVGLRVSAAPGTRLAAAVGDHQPVPLSEVVTTLSW